MSEGALVLIGLAGFGCFSIWLINVCHGFGVPEGPRLWALRAVLVAAIAGIAWVVFGPALLDGDAPPPASRWSLSLCASLLLVGLPFVTGLRHVRRRSIGISADQSVIDFETEAPAHDLIGPGRPPLLLAVPGNRPFQVERNDWTLPFQGLPESLDGLTILQFSDLHLCDAYSLRFYEALVERLAEVEADLVVFSGDLLDDAAMIDRVPELLGRLGGTLGRFAILGNHDHRFDQARVRDAVERAGFALLDGDWRRVERGSASLAVGGTCAPWGRPLDASTMPAADFRLVNSHTPDLFPKAAGWGVDLVLCGHTHGGQCRLPVIGPVFLPSLHGRWYDEGLFRRRGSSMYVNRGVAGTHPLRVNCAPEFATFTLKRAAVDGTKRAARRRRALAGRHRAEFETAPPVDPCAHQM